MINITRYNRVFRLFRRIGYSPGIQKMIALIVHRIIKLSVSSNIDSLVDAILDLEPDSRRIGWPRDFFFVCIFQYTLYAYTFNACVEFSSCSFLWQA